MVRGKDRSFWCWHPEPRSSHHPHRVPPLRVGMGQGGEIVVLGVPEHEPSSLGGL